MNWTRVVCIYIERKLYVNIQARRQVLTLYSPTHKLPRHDFGQIYGQFVREYILFNQNLVNLLLEGPINNVNSNLLMIIKCYLREPITMNACSFSYPILSLAKKFWVFLYVHFKTSRLNTWCIYLSSPGLSCFDMWLD